MTCARGTCPYAGVNPFASQGRERVRRTNRRSGEEDFRSHGDERSSRRGGFSGFSEGHRSGFGLQQAEEIFRAFFGGLHGDRQHPVVEFGGFTRSNKYSSRGMQLAQGEPAAFGDFDRDPFFANFFSR